MRDSSITNEFFYRDYDKKCLLATVHDDGIVLCLSTTQYGIAANANIVSLKPDKVKELIKFLKDNFGE